jgi:hypothetical protein
MARGAAVRWFFAHGGSTRGRSIAALDASLRAALLAHPTFDADEIVGGDSILAASGWYADPAVAVANAAALGVDHVVFGHDPNALGARGAIAVAQDRRLLRIDGGMSPSVNDSDGRLLRIRQEGGAEVAEEVGVAGVRALFRSP